MLHVFVCFFTVTSVLKRGGKKVKKIKKIKSQV